GNVGIGTTGPGSMLHLNNPTSGEAIKISRGTGSVRLTKGLDSDNLFLFNSDATINMMTWLGTGNVGIGTTVPGAKLQVDADTNVVVGLILNTTQAAGGTLARFTTTGTVVGSITVTGSATAYNTSSDVRLKENIENSTLGLEALNQIQVREFNFISEPSKRIQGFIAQELYGIYPDAVFVGGDNVVTKPWQVDYARLTPLLVKSIQELDTKIKELEARMASSSGETVVVESSGSGTTEVISGTVDVLGTLAEAVITQVQTLWAKGDIVAEGIRKTYFAVANMTIFKDLNIADWGTREITIAPEAPSEIVSLFQGNGAQAAENSKVDLQENGAYLATYGVDSTRGEIQLSGSSKLVNGEAKVFFDFSFSSIISSQVPLKVLLTPTTDSVRGQLVVIDKTPYGFTVKELNGVSSGKFDWLVIARRAGYEGADAQNLNIETSKDLNMTSSSSEDLNTGSASASPELSSSPSSSEPTPTASATPEPSPSPSESSAPEAPTTTPETTLVSEPPATTASQ
ncbi:MAG: tail fiber domain-containing protein, partial [Candidatus Colwellbacteria bacterium]